jgi:hypothetical protein
MAHPEPTDENLRGLRRANRDDEQHWSQKGWQKINGGKDREILPSSETRTTKALATAAKRSPVERETIGADYTRSPFDPLLARDEQGHVRKDRADVLRGYDEPRPERNFPATYNRDELIEQDLDPALEYPESTTATFKILAVALGLVLFGLLAAMLFWNFLPPVRKAPEGPEGRSQPKTVAVQQFAAFVSRMNERR